MSDEIEMEPEPVLHPCEPVPGYLLLPAELRDEGRRAFVIAFMALAEGALVQGWEADAVKLDQFLKTGDIPHTTKKANVRAV